MRENYFVQTKLAVISTEDLLEAFYQLASSNIETPVEIANVYAIFVALTFKEPSEVKDFFKKSLEIKFEWFAIIAQYYLEDPTPVVSYKTVKIVPKIETTNISNLPFGQGPSIQKMHFGQ